ncbi:MAG: class I SAM-dependent methyltransferase [Planctomycetota bacterium]|jgi:ubiquinone/menaquinone biosynthesis C-methylase UbiE
MRRVDYDDGLHERYGRGRALSADVSRLWMESLARHLPRHQGFVVLDLGSGTGRFSPCLADYFSAHVIGVEPSDKMRTIAEESNAHPRVSYLKGKAESIPVGDEQFDFAFLSMVIHHVDDMSACCRELCRVLKPRGKVFVRNSFKDRLGNVRFYDFFPSARAIDHERLPSVEKVQRAFAGAGFDSVGLVTVRQQIDASMRDHYERIKKRAVSTFEFISDEEFEQGIAVMKQVADNEAEPSPVTEDIDLLVFEKGRGP